MNNQEIIKKMNKIFMEVLDLSALELKEETTASDIEEWDSLNNIQLIVAIETFFEIIFRSTEIENFKNIGEMVLSINAKLKAK